MKHGPKGILAALGGSAVALCASVVLATPALADSIQYGCLVFDSQDTIGEIVTQENGVVTVAGGTAETAITVTQNTSTEATDDVTKVLIGSDAADYTGSITFTGIASDTVPADAHPLSIMVGNANPGGTVTIDDCNLIGTEPDEPAIIVLAESDVNLNVGDSTIQGAPGAKGQQELAGNGITIVDESTLTVSGTVKVGGGNGGDAASESAAPGAGGYGIYAPNATLVMTNGDLTAQAGYTGSGSKVEPTALPVGLTVGTMKLSNGTGKNGQGPSITATGWPQETSKPLPVSGIDAGDPADGDFYPWVLQASFDMTGEDPFIMEYAGSGDTDPVQRAGWQWFNIAPHPATALKVVAISSGGDVTPDLVQQMNLRSDEPSRISYDFGIAPSFQNLADVPTDSTIVGARVDQPTFDPEGALQRDVETGLYFVAPGNTANTVTISGAVSGLPSAFTTLYPDIPATVNTQVPITRSEIIYRLYNQYEGTHLYTKDLAEIESCVKAGWTDEGEFWVAPVDQANGDYVICRLRNPYNGDHYYIKQSNTNGIAYLESLGWKRDSAASSFLSCPQDSGLPIRTLYNPFSKVDTHLYTPYENEVATLTGLGWKEDATIIYALPFIFGPSGD